MAKKKTERIGVITPMEQFRYLSGKMHYGMGDTARQGSGAWKDRRQYDRSREKKKTREDPDYGRAAKCERQLTVVPRSGLFIMSGR